MSEKTTVVQDTHALVQQMAQEAQMRQRMGAMVDTENPDSVNDYFAYQESLGKQEAADAATAASGQQDWELSRVTSASSFDVQSGEAAPTEQDDQDLLAYMNQLANMSVAELKKAREEAANGENIEHRLVAERLYSQKLLEVREKQAAIKRGQAQAAGKKKRETVARAAVADAHGEPAGATDTASAEDAGESPSYTPHAQDDDKIVDADVVETITVPATDSSDQAGEVIDAEIVEPVEPQEPITLESLLTDKDLKARIDGELADTIASGEFDEEAFSAFVKRNNIDPKLAGVMEGSMRREAAGHSQGTGATGESTAPQTDTADQTPADTGNTPEPAAVEPAPADPQNQANTGNGETSNETGSQPAEPAEQAAPEPTIEPLRTEGDLDDNEKAEIEEMVKNVLRAAEQAGRASTDPQVLQMLQSIADAKKVDLAYVGSIVNGIEAEKVNTQRINDLAEAVIASTSLNEARTGALDTEAYRRNGVSKEDLPAVRAAVKAIAEDRASRAAHDRHDPTDGTLSPEELQAQASARSAMQFVTLDAGNMRVWNALRRRQVDFNHMTIKDHRIKSYLFNKNADETTPENIIKKTILAVHKEMGFKAELTDQELDAMTAGFKQALLDLNVIDEDGMRKVGTLSKIESERLNAVDWMTDLGNTHVYQVRSLKGKQMVDSDRKMPESRPLLMSKKAFRREQNARHDVMDARIRYFDGTIRMMNDRLPDMPTDDTIAAFVKDIQQTPLAKQLRVTQTQAEEVVAWIRAYGYQNGQTPNRPYGYRNNPAAPLNTPNQGRGFNDAPAGVDEVLMRAGQAMIDAPWFDPQTINTALGWGDANKAQAVYDELMRTNSAAGLMSDPLLLGTALRDQGVRYDNLQRAANQNRAPQAAAPAAPRVVTPENAVNSGGTALDQYMADNNTAGKWISFLNSSKIGTFDVSSALGGRIKTAQLAPVAEYLNSVQPRVQEVFRLNNSNDRATRAAAAVKYNELKVEIEQNVGRIAANPTQASSPKPSVNVVPPQPQAQQGPQSSVGAGEAAGSPADNPTQANSRVAGFESDMATHATLPRWLDAVHRGDAVSGSDVRTQLGNIADVSPEAAKQIADLVNGSQAEVRTIYGALAANQDVDSVRRLDAFRSELTQKIKNIVEDDVARAEVQRQEEDARLMDEAARLVIDSQLGSVSMLQRKLDVSFKKAEELMQGLEMRGVVSSSDGRTKAREVLIAPPESSGTDSGQAA